MGCRRVNKFSEVDEGRKELGRIHKGRSNRTVGVYLMIMDRRTHISLHDYDNLTIRILQSRDLDATNNRSDLASLLSLILRIFGSYSVRKKGLENIF